MHKMYSVSNECNLHRFTARMQSLRVQCLSDSRRYHHQEGVTQPAAHGPLSYLTLKPFNPSKLCPLRPSQLRAAVVAERRRFVTASASTARSPKDAAGGAAGLSVCVFVCTSICSLDHHGLVSPACMQSVRARTDGLCGFSAGNFGFLRAPPLPLPPRPPPPSPLTTTTTTTTKQLKKQLQVHVQTCTQHPHISTRTGHFCMFG